MVRERGVCLHYNILKDKAVWVVRYAAFVCYGCIVQ